MSVYRRVLRPALFRMSPDRSHQLGQAALRWAPPWRALSAATGLSRQDPALRTTFAGLTLASPVGLAAGMDKDVELVGALSCLGFGFVTVGTIMPEPRAGNPPPRLVRWPDREALVDSMGVPSRGLESAVERLSRSKSRGTPVFANVGGFTADAIARSVQAVRPHVDGVEINLMCPNLPAAAEQYDALSLLHDVLDRVDGGRASLVVRVPNDIAEDEDRLAKFVETCVARGVGGLKVGGGYTVEEPGLGSGRGTVHGRVVFERALAHVERAAQLAAGRIAIKGNGGISSASDVIAMLEAGATCVDLYSAFIYQGWTVARDLNRELARRIGP